MKNYKNHIHKESEKTDVQAVASPKTERKLIDKASFLLFYDNLVNGLGKCKFGDIMSASKSTCLHD